MTIRSVRPRAWYGRALKVAAVLRYQPYRRALRFGVAASTEHADTPLPHDYATVIDVGANRGQFALLARRRFPHARIFCFEPLDAPRATIERVFSDRRMVRVIGTAVGASACETQLFMSRADDSSSLLAPTELQLAAFPGTDVVGEIRLQTARLDAVLDPGLLVSPTLLKVDVQGTELYVLIGAAGLLAYIDTILVECSFVELYHGQPLADEVIRFLHQQDFRLASVTNACVADGQILQADLVFARRSREP